MTQRLSPRRFPSLALMLAAALLTAPAVSPGQSGGQITIAQPADATTMDPGRSTQVLTVNYLSTSTTP